MSESQNIDLRIAQALQRIEATHAVRVLLAVESGSRAWGFASPDSDYDVRFVYVHAPEWYVRVRPGPDVLEVALDAELDVSGWELRKALGLFAKSNVPLYEWLDSPVIYREAGAFRPALRAEMPVFFNPIAATHHYRSMARAALEAAGAGPDVRLKKLLYTLRAVFACRWIVRERRQPPTAFAPLTGAVASAGEQAWVRELVETKARASERECVSVDLPRMDALRSELQHLESVESTLPGPPRRTGELEPLDALLRTWVFGSGRDGAP